MRELTNFEAAAVSGAEHHDVVVYDPVAAIQTFLFLATVTDQQGFQSLSTITGMAGGAIAGGWSAGAWAYAGYGIAGAIGAGAVGAVGGAFALGAVCRYTSKGAVSMYNTLMS